MSVKQALAEYIWIDGTQPTALLRSKARHVAVPENPGVQDFPEWSFDGSSTAQADGDDSDCLLQPVRVLPNPTRKGGGWLVLCEVFNADGTPHASNTRHVLREVLDAGASAHQPWIGFEQEYVLMAGGKPLGFPEIGFPAPQGPYYCGVGNGRIHGRDVAEDHAQACQDAGLLYYGMNAEVMPGQWEFQVGYRGDKSEAVDVLSVSDHLWLGRWLLHRVAEDHGVEVSFSNKPVKGDWNGSGMHTNFSTGSTRETQGGLQAMSFAIERLAQRHAEHIRVYGDGLADRLTGLHETCSIEEFKSGTADRGASIRIPQSVQLAGGGYLEDRRPGANADPYVVAASLCATVTGRGLDSLDQRFQPNARLAA